MRDTLRHLAAGAAHLALSAGLLWMGHSLAQAQPHGTAAAAGTVATQAAPPTTATTASAAALYREHCASCHGAQRTGGMGPALLPESLARLRRPEALKVIQEGRAATQMAGFAGTLAPADIAALTDWIYQPVTPTPAWSDADVRASRVETAGEIGRASCRERV